MVSTRSRKQSSKEEDIRTRREDEQWETIYSGLNQLLRKQQSQLETLIEERRFITQRLLVQHHSSSCHLHLLHDHVSQLRRQLQLSELANKLYIAKAELFSAFHRRDAFLFTHKLEDTRCELDDFKAWFDILSHRCPDLKDIDLNELCEVLRAKADKNRLPEAASEQYKMLEKEVASLKREYEKLSVKYSSEVASLRSENKFAWTQYNEKEINLTNQLQAKIEEVNTENDKIIKLKAVVEQLQSSNTGKDMIVSTLRANVKRLEDEALQKDEMITSCSKELEVFKSKSPSGIPTLKRCSVEPLPSSSKRARISRDDESPEMEEGSSSAQLEAANATLRTQVNKLEVEADLKNEEIARLSKELNLLRSKAAGDTPVFNRCTSNPSSSMLRNQGNRRSRRSAVPKEEASSKQPVSENGGKRGKRNQEEVLSIEETPRLLFTSDFKIPKLKKSQSPRR